MNHRNQPIIPQFTLQNYKISVNSACIRSLPEFDFVQIMINPYEKKLALRPCKEGAKNALRWCSATEKRCPRKISCRIFYAKIMLLMGWNPMQCYRLLGDLVHTEKEPVFVFDLNEPNICTPKTEHCSPFIQTITINEFTVFHLQNNPRKETREVTT